MPADPLTIEYSPGVLQGQGVLHLSGPLTMENVAQFQSAVRREDASTMIIDLSKVPYIDSAGLGSIVGAYASLKKSGRLMALTGVNQRVTKLFEITQVQHLFLTFPSLWDAIDALSNPARA